MASQDYRATAPRSLGLRWACEKVLLAAPRGFCAGVEMAIKALAWMVRAFEPPVYCYHEIVHNRLVVDRFRDLGVVFVDDIAEVPDGRAAHAERPRVGARGRRGGPGQRRATWSTPSARSSPRCTTRSRCGPARATASSTSATRATTRRSARWRWRPTPSTWSSPRTTSPRSPAFDDPVALLAQTTLSATATGRACRRAPRERFPDLWMPGRSDLCFATTNRQSALMEIAATLRCRSSSSARPTRRTPSPSRSWRASRAAPGCYRVNGADELPDDLDGHGRASPPGPRRPRSWSTPSSTGWHPSTASRRCAITDEDEYFPPPRRAARPARRGRRAGHVRVRRIRARPAGGQRPPAARQRRPGHVGLSARYAGGPSAMTSRTAVAPMSNGEKRTSHQVAPAVAQGAGSSPGQPSTTTSTGARNCVVHGARRPARRVARASPGRSGNTRRSGPPGAAASGWPPAGDPERHPGLLYRCGLEGHAIGDVVRALVSHLVARPQRGHEVEPLVEHLAAGAVVELFAEGGQLPGRVAAGADPEHESPAREPVDAARLAGDDVWPPPGKRRDERTDPHACSVATAMAASVIQASATCVAGARYCT